METGKLVLAVSTMFFLLLTCTSNVMTGQENYAVRIYTTDQGLPHNHVRGIAQDQNGFLWIATWDGLSRWNGYEFRNYYNNPADTTSLIYFQTDDVLVDYQNNVWVYTLTGISKYNRERDNFTPFRVGISVKITLDKEGKLWYMSGSDLWRWDYNANKFILVPLEMDNKLLQSRIIHPLYISFDNENRLWIISPEGEDVSFYRCNNFDNGGFKANFIGNLKNIGLYQNLNYFNSKFELYSFREQDFWIQTNNWTFQLDRKTAGFKPSPGNTALLESSGLNSDDLRHVRGNMEYYKPIVRDKEIHSKIKPIYVENYLVDRQNTLWQCIIGSGLLSTGLTRTAPVSKGIKHYFFDQNPTTGLNAIFPVLKDRFGTLWAGPTNVNRFFRMTKDGQTSGVTPLDWKTWKAVRQPRSFLEDSTGIWIGYFDNLLLRYDFKSGKFSKTIFKTSGKLDRSLPRNLLHLKKIGDEIFIFGFQEISKFNTKTLKTDQLKIFDVNSDFNLYSVNSDDSGGWWIGRNRSILIHLDDHYNEIGSFVIGTGLFNIEDIVTGDNNDLWLSRLGGGLAHFDKSTGESKIYTTADGLSNNTCYGLLKDKHGNIWISTNHGISRFNPKTEQFRAFGAEDGLKIDEFNSDNTFMSPDGEMFFGGMGGVVSFYPDSLSDIQTGQVAAPLVIEDFKVSGENRYFKKAIYACDTVVLKKGDDNFEISFASLDFRNAEKIKYRYRLRGGNDQFIQTDFRHRFLNYANLSPGNYQLDLEATNRDGAWASRTKLMIIIPPYFYQNLWFRLLLAVLLILVIIQLIYSYNHRLRMNSRKRQDELQLESLRGQMNPHFIFNSMNSINYFISQNDRLSANRYIADFSRLIRTFLGNLSKEFVLFDNELESLRDYLQLEHLRFGDKFDYKIELQDGLSPELITIFPGMVQPFIENAIWHGVRGLANRKGMVIIRFAKGGKGYITCIVEDDGVGRKLSEARKNVFQSSKSKGIQIVADRLRIINQIRNENLQLIFEELYPENEEAGTRVVIQIPTGLEGVKK